MGGYYHNTATKKVSTPSDAVIAVRDTYEKGISFFTAFKDNMKIFTHLQTQRTKDMRRAYNMVGTTSPKYFKNMVHGQLVKKILSPTKILSLLTTFFGPDVSSLEGKTIHTQPNAVTMDIVVIPMEISSFHKRLLSQEVLFLSIPWNLLFLSLVIYALERGNTFI